MSSPLEPTGANPPVVSIHAPSWDAYGGYGRIALELVWHLNQAGVYTNAMNVPRGEIIHHSQTEAIQTLLNRRIRATTGGLMLGYPTLREGYSPLLSAGPSVAITMFESTKLPDGWVESLNQCQAVIVPSLWNVDIFKQCGVRVPVHRIPLGVSGSFYPVQRRHGTPYTFLTWGDRGLRKGWDLAFAAFSKAFGDSPAVKLIIKTRVNAFPYQPTQKHPNVEVLEADLSESELMDLYASVDCMVYPARGEGFGLPPREFAATAGPVICTEAWADDLVEWGYPVRSKMVPAWQGYERFAGLGKWAEADLDHLAQQMQHVVKQNRGIIEHMGRRSARFIDKTYRWETFARQVWAVWNNPLHEETLAANGPAQGNVALGRQRRRERRQHASNG